MNPTRRYVYGGSWPFLVGLALVFGAISLFMAHHASLIDPGVRVIFNDLIPLNVTGAKVYYWFRIGLSCLIVALSALIAALALLSVARRLTRPRMLELAEDVMLLPHGLFHTRTATIPYTNIRRVWEKTYANGPALSLVTGERTFGISALLLPDIESYNAVKEFMYSRVPVPTLASISLEPLPEAAGEEFRSKKAVVDHHLRHLGPLPWGIVFSLTLIVPLIAVAMLLLLCVLPFTEYLPADRVRLSVYAISILVFCVVAFGIFHFADKWWKKRLRDIDLECPSCHQLLSASGKIDISSRRCPTCGRPVVAESGSGRR